MVKSRFTEILLLSFSLLVAAALLFHRLTDFPLYFFCDEAVQSAEVSSLLATGTDRAGVAWPLFIRGHGNYALSLSVYWLMPFQALLGSSEFVVRLSSAVASMLGVTAAAFFIRRLYPTTLIWTAVPLVFYGAAFWYLHSRTGFEVVISVSAWLVCLAIFPSLWASPSASEEPRTWCSKMARIAPWISFVVAFAFCFYSYTPARGWAILTVVLLIGAWWPMSHTQWRRTALLGALLVLVVAPYLITALLRPEVAFRRLHDLLPNGAGFFTWQRVEAALHQLLTILDPRYWFSADTRFESSERHTIPGLGMIPVYYLPFAAIGLLYCLRQFRTRPEARVLILLFPVGAFPAVLVGVTPLRCMPVGLVYVLWTCVGLAASIEFLDKWIKSGRIQLLALSALVAQLAWLSFYVFSTALTAYSDYGFYGVQMGQREVFAWVRANLDRYPLIRLTHAAFNGNEALVDFYLPIERRRQLRVESADAPCVLDQAEREVWILRQERITELEAARCALQLETLHTITDPRGEPLFAAVVLTPLAGFTAAASGQR